MPSRNGSITATCGICGDPLPAGRSRAWCSDACRQAAWRRRHQPNATPEPLPASHPKKPITVYECPSCEQRQLGQQRCDDCNTWMRAVGIGGHCPCCDEPVAITELIDA